MVDTGQHYDERMRRVFFEELRLAEPAIKLEVGSGTHAEQTAAALVGLERAINDVSPVWVLVYGDTNATLSGALAAAKVNVSVAHVEAGLRSFKREMPEEVNRVVVDHLSACLFCPSAAAAQNLSREGIREGVFVVGDVMVDSLRWACEQSRPAGLRLPDRPYAVATLHRPANTDDPAKLQSAMACLAAAGCEVVFPAHPRIRKLLAAVTLPLNVRPREAFSFVEMVHAVKGAEVVLTDSGGLQKEAYLLGKPVLTLREETEWTETLEGGWNRLVGTDPECVRQALGARRDGSPRADVYGDGRAAERVVHTLNSLSADRA